jgi:hypothetical protein
MTRTWLQRMMQQNDTDLLSYDFADSQPTWKSWWFRITTAIVCTGIIWYLFV